MQPGRNLESLERERFEGLVDSCSLLKEGMEPQTNAEKPRRFAPATCGNEKGHRFGIGKGCGVGYYGR